MKESRNPKRGIHRRDLIKGTAAAGLAITVGVEGAVAAPATDNPIRKESAELGTRDWLLTKTDITKNEPVELWRSPLDWANRHPKVADLLRKHGGKTGEEIKAEEK